MTINMNQKISLAIVLGTARKGRQSENVARYVINIIKKRKDIRSMYIDVRRYVKEPVTTPPWEKTKKTKDWKDVAAQADAFLFVIPEYNHGYPGEFKLLLDQAYEEYEHKPVALCTVSSGKIGGARLVEHLQPVFNELSLTNTGYLYFPQVEDLFDGKSEMKDEKYEKRVGELVDTLVVYAAGLKGIREKLSK